MKVGFLSFGHWGATLDSQVRTASDALQPSIELAVAAEEPGADGASFRVLTSPGSSVRHFRPF